MKAWEYNFDGLVGPSHNYAGLSIGNKASMKNKEKSSKPQKAALEGLEKMKFLMDRGFKQAVLPPHERPALSFLKELGLTGSKEKILQSAWDFSPALLSACYSASSMWTANMATVSPSSDTKDKKLHFTPANLHFHLHRSLEAKQNALILKKIFPDTEYFTHHPPLPSVPVFSDEGAANHSRICSDYSEKALELFVYGREAFSSHRQTKVFYPRQSQTAGKQIALQHQLDTEETMQIQQNSQAIDAGVFHNDVIFTADKNFLFYHEQAFTNTTKIIQEIEKKLQPTPILKVEVKSKDISLETAVSSYLFNSQLLPVGKNKWLLLAPSDCEEDLIVKNYLKSLQSSDSPIHEIQFLPLRQSMQNGGGPACLRLRVVLTKPEVQSFHQGVFLTESLYKKLKLWIKKHYREKLMPKDLLDPLLIEENQRALDELSQILGLGSIYPFQKENVLSQLDEESS